MKTDDRKIAAQKLQEAHDNRTVGEQLTIAQSRPGESKAEVSKLKDWLQLQGVTKKTLIKEVKALISPPKKADAGWTLVELLIAAAIAGVVLAAITGLGRGGCHVSSEATKKDALEFAQRIDPNATVECVDRDTDNDGYVSCTVFRPGKNPVGIECAAGFTINSGCRMPKLSNVRVE